MPKSVTMRDIALRLELHYSTVSLALRQDPRIPKETQNKVKWAAQQMGYTPNPIARALAIHKQRVRPATDHGTLAMLMPKIFPSVYLLGAQERAAMLGYRVETLAYRDPVLNEDRLTQILKSRGITGLLVLSADPSSKALKRLRLDWAYFSAVTFSHSLLWPPIHRVGDNQFRNMKRLIRELAALGYRRIGFFTDEPRVQLAAEGGWRGGYMMEMERWGKFPPPLYRKDQVYDQASIRRWIQQHRLEAVITDHDYAAQQVIELAGRSVPNELGVASLACGEEATSGINPQFSEIGGVAVDFLVHLMNSNQRGIPRFPQRILLEGSWWPGTTVRRIRPKT